MKKVLITLTTILSLMSCSPKDSTKVAIENEIGVLSIQADGVSVPVDYEVIFYSLTGTTTAKEQNRKKWRKYSGKVRRYELSLANDIARIERTGDSTYTDVQFSRYMISIYNDSLQYLKRIQDDIVALDYSVQIEYYHPTIKVNVTQEKKVTLKAL